MLYTTLSPYILANDHDNDNSVPQQSNDQEEHSTRTTRVPSTQNTVGRSSRSGIPQTECDAAWARAGEEDHFSHEMQRGCSGEGCNGRSYHAARPGDEDGGDARTAGPRQRGVRRATASGSSGCVPRRRPPGEARGAPGEDPRAEGRAICCGARGVLSAKYSAVVDTRRWRRRWRRAALRPDTNATHRDDVDTGLDVHGRDDDDDDDYDNVDGKMKDGRR